MRREWIKDMKVYEGALLIITSSLVVDLLLSYNETCENKGVKQTYLRLYMVCILLMIMDWIDVL